MTHDQTLLDHLYWDTKTTLKDIAAQVGVKPTDVKRLASPRPIGVSCPVCHIPLVDLTRNDVDRFEARCPQCRLSRSRTPSWVDRHGQTLPCDGVVVLLEQSHATSPYEQVSSRVSGASAAVRALHAAGFGWDEERLVVSCSYPPHTPGLIEEVLSLEAKVVAMASPDVLVLNHRQFVTAVARLQDAGCRVVCDRAEPDYHRRAIWYGDVLGELDDPDEGLPFLLLRRSSSSPAHRW